MSVHVQSRKDRFHPGTIFLHFLYLSLILGLFLPIVSLANEMETNLLTFSGIDKAQKHSTGEGTIVAVIDWQFDLNGKAGKKYIHPVSLIDDEPIGQLKPWHGEWMAEIIHTIAPEAKIIPIKARGLQDHDYKSHIPEAIRYAADHGACAVCSSMGPLEQTPELETAIDYAEQKGLIFIDVHPEYCFNSEGKMLYLEEKSLDHRILHTGIVSVPDHPVKVESLRDINVWPYDLQSHYQDGWGFSNGPPVVAGTIALVKSLCPSMTNDELRHLLCETTTKREGFPVLNAEAAVEQALVE